MGGDVTAVGVLLGRICVTEGLAGTDDITVELILVGIALELRGIEVMLELGNDDVMLELGNDDVMLELDKDDVMMELGNDDVMMELGNDDVMMELGNDDVIEVMGSDDGIVEIGMDDVIGRLAGKDETSLVGARMLGVGRKVELGMRGEESSVGMSEEETAEAVGIRDVTRVMLGDSVEDEVLDMPSVES